MKLKFLLIFLLACGGCQYYRVTDPASGKVYYTNNWESHRNYFNGSMNFTDQESGKTVTLQNSEVEDVPKDEVPQREHGPQGTSMGKGPFAPY